MKTILLAAVFSITSLFAFGQLSYSPSKTYSLTIGMNEGPYYDGIEFTNDGAMNVNVDWQLITFDTVPGCLFDMCASGACLYKVPAAGNFPSLTPDELGWLKLHIQSGSNPGVNTIQFVINESGGHAPDTLTYLITVLNNVSVNEIAEAAFRVYPNPFSDELTVAGLRNGTVTVYNISGQVICEKSISTLENKLDLSSLDKGVYFLRCKDEEGMTSMKKIIKN